jgi:hypothetical protein
MGNPVITRLGINQFWYKHWYSDTTQALNIKQDDSFEKLINIYLNYGLVFKTNPFLHEYWYRKFAHKIRVFDQEERNTKFFRRFFYTNDNLSIEHTYLIRNRTGEYFPMRTWVMKYGGWVIICVNWFKPLKTRRAVRLGSGDSSFVGAVSRPTIHNFTIRRLKLVALNYLLSKSSSTKGYTF